MHSPISTATRRGITLHSESASGGRRPPRLPRSTSFERRPAAFGGVRRKESSSVGWLLDRGDIDEHWVSYERHDRPGPPDPPTRAVWSSFVMAANSVGDSPSRR